MKKYLYIAIALFACTLGFTACGNDSDDSGYPIVPDKGAAVAGNYNGTWTIVDADGNKVAEANGTIILAKDGEAKDYVVVSMADNAGARLKAMNGKANIAQQAKRFIITNTTEQSGLVNVDNVKAGYRIFVGEKNDIIMQFTMEKTGRGGYTHRYTFEGNKSVPNN